MVTHTANSFALTRALSSIIVPERFLFSHLSLCLVLYDTAKSQAAIKMYFCLLHPIHAMNVVGCHLKMMTPEVISVTPRALMCEFSARKIS